ncbi:MULTISPECIES: hypothetical protein [Serratia]|uniref:Uncharacterized protein n=1 Tax=Serratia marcescens TaxID=615 RepID=A0ABD5BRG6_SERMA|nr:hypothetical protein [Serratia marcescens]MDQ9388632.1 hypothetical protein [Serratia marcescens]MDQ9405205.1 hypothetical protein [Serratia marcescens]MDQ9439841.1 hypothetical protein [Serratia marcescens]MDQ9474329.1 hypothetical protein [Serratia marcescens]MDQ9542344.1 hypothetical protein [Serratia marcescens]
MSKALFADLAEQFLSVAVKTWVIRSELPAAAAADVLLTTAIQQGFLEDRGRPLLGNTLNEWGKNKKYPRWAIQSAMALLWADGWKPVTHPEWAAYAAIHVQSKKGGSLTQLLDVLPGGLDIDVAAGWICAATEDAARYHERKKLR